jgi:aspartyl-tRNA(Asn)/glutamyl-tRNA(Gln) amidotransferase subunit A
MVPDYLRIAEAARLIEKRELSPVELVDSRLDRIARLDGQLHSFIRVLTDVARHEARATEAEIAAGKYRGPLHGIPIGLKDISNPIGAGSPGFRRSRVCRRRPCIPGGKCRSFLGWREASATAGGRGRKCASKA